MKIRQILLLVGAVLPLAACSSYRGGTGDDEYSTGTYVGEGQPEPSASPTFRPGMNPEDPRDPHFTTRPEATQTMPPP